MKANVLITAILALFFGKGMAQSGNRDANELVSFLEGEWHNYTIFLSQGDSVKKQNYKETMQIKNDSTLTITAHHYQDGEDLTRDMILVVNDNAVVMQQGDFKAIGTREGNAYYLKGVFQEKEYRFRLYTMIDKYVFHSEVWADGKIEMMNMSYLLRE